MRESAAPRRSGASTPGAMHSASPRRSSAIFSTRGSPSSPAHRLRPTIDAVIVLGGDGLLMHAACDYAAYDCPVLGINLGHLGFLTAAWSERGAAGRCGACRGPPPRPSLPCWRAASPRQRRTPSSSRSATSSSAAGRRWRASTSAYRLADARLPGLMDLRSRPRPARPPTTVWLFGPLIDPAVDCMIPNIRAPQPLPFPPVVVHPSRTLDIDRYLWQHRLADPRRPDRPAAGPRRAGDDPRGLDAAGQACPPPRERFLRDAQRQVQSAAAHRDRAVVAGDMQSGNAANRFGARAIQPGGAV